MKWWSSDCQQVILSPDVTAVYNSLSATPQVITCWNLWILFTERLVNYLLVRNPLLSWAEGSVTTGLRVQIQGFWCSGQQSIPQAALIMPLSGSYAAYQYGLRV